MTTNKPSADGAVAQAPDNGQQAVALDQVRIWSYEHDAYWRPNSMGYTRKKAEAGLYDREEADAIVAGANIGCAPDKPMECIEELDGQRGRRLSRRRFSEPRWLPNDLPGQRQ